MLFFFKNQIRKKAIFDISLSFLSTIIKSRKSLPAGFTLVELLISISILTLLSSLAFPVYNNLYASTKLEEAAIYAEEELMVTRNLAASGYNDSNYGLYFDISVSGIDKMIRYRGDSYVARETSYDVIKNFDEAIEVSSTFSGNEINFSNGTGAPSNVGSVDILYNDGSTRKIIINEYGIILNE